jgi:hypothetical protein
VSRGGERGRRGSEWVKEGWEGGGKGGGRERKDRGSEEEGGGGGRRGGERRRRGREWEGEWEGRGG